VADDQTGWDLAGFAPVAREQFLISLGLVDWRFEFRNGVSHGVKSSMVGIDLPERAPLFRGAWLCARAS
jgi:hypothetical protein